MDWNDLKYVLAVSRSNSFKNAARLMKVSHTTVGRRVQALEEALNTALFERQANGVRPTEYCVRLLDVAERMEAEFQTFSESIFPPNETPEGVVRINTAPWIIAHVLCPAVPRLRRDHPGIQLLLIGDVVETHTDYDDVGFSLRFDVQARRQEIEFPLCVVPYSVYGPRGMPDADQWITNDYVRVALRTRQWLQEHYEDPDIALAASDADIVRAAIAAGVGKGLIPDFLGAGDDRLERRSGPEPELVRRYRALVPRHVAPDPAFRAVFAWLREALSGHFAQIPQSNDAL